MFHIAAWGYVTNRSRAASGKETLYIGIKDVILRMGFLICATGLFLAAAGILEAQVLLSGRVVNETNAPVAGARLTVAAGEMRLYTVTNPTGEYQLSIPNAGSFLVSVEREGHFALKDRPVTLMDGENELNLTLNRLREIIESVDVKAGTSEVALDTTASQQTLSGNEILNVPYPTTNNLKNALRVVPGIVQDVQGDLHLNGGSAEQVQYMLDGFNISDPLTNRFDSRLSVEGVQSVEIVSGRMPAEYGKGSAGVISIRSKPGDDRWRSSATNFVPGIENQKGIYVGNWTPRVNLSGPILKGRAWFSNSFDVQYDRSMIPELPEGADSASSWRFSNLLNNQFNVTPSNILFTSLLVNYWFAPKNGLGALDPPETTVDRRARQYFFNVRNQKFFGRGALLEVGFGINRTFGREIPQGQELYAYTPGGKRGNYFVDALRESSRDQWLANLFLPTVNFAGSHQLKGGIDLDRLRYRQDVSRTGYVFYRLDGSPVRQTEFHGNGFVQRANFESAAYLQDSWKVRSGLLLELGVRTDWDEIIRNWNMSPRAGFAWSPPRLDNTKISGGYAVTYDATNLRYFTRPDDQYALTTYFQADGEINRGPAVSVFRINSQGLRSARYQNWTASVDQRLPHSVSLRVHWLRKMAGRGLTYANTLDASGPPADAIAQFNTRYFDGIYYLTNRRRDSYNSVEFTVRQVLKGQYEWTASYTRSAARSNAVLDVAMDEPLTASVNSGPMPWDAPNRFLSWGYLPTFWKNWAVAYLMEYRTGFPFSIVDEDGVVAGSVNSVRFPIYFDLNLHLERKFAFRGHRWALRFGFNNITNHKNPNTVINTLGSPDFMTYHGGQHRALNFRIRWLGKM